MNESYPSVSAALRGGARDAFGVPAAVLGAGFIGYGALAAGAGYSVWLAMVASAVIWALPGQLALLELHAVGAGAVVIVLAVMLTAARLLPMTMVLMPVLRDSRYSRPTVYFAAHLVAMTGWAAGMRRCPELPRAQRLPYFLGFALTCWATSITCCALGYLLAGSFPPLMRLGFIFLTPVYFFVILIGEVRSRMTAVALACGAFSGPLFYLINAQWSVLLSGFAGGTLAYLIQRHFGNGDG